VALKGRHWLSLWLLGFLAVAIVVVVRQRAAVRLAGRLRALDEERTTLDARRAELQRRIADATSRGTLGASAETGLGLHVPSDSEFARFTVPAREGR